MATISEDYVSFETAKLLKEKGFDGACNRVYQGPNLKYTTIPISPLMSLGEFGGFHPKQLYVTNNELGDIAYTAPTLQMAMKWLREVHNINFNISWNPTFKDYFVEIFKPTLLYSTITYQNYEEACEEAIKYCLEDIL